ncbi:hypothetical protein ABZ682_18385 [Streptomyces griseoviridis]
MRSQEAQDRAAMANTKIVYAADPALRLAQRTDGSYYRATTASEYSSYISYDYTTVQDQDVVVPGTVTTQEQRPTGFLWYRKTFANHITVRIIDPHEADRTPRLEWLRCTVQPIDPSKPSYRRPARQESAGDRVRPGRRGRRNPEWSLLERRPAAVPGPDHDPRAGREYPAVADWARLWASAR